jgi:hypothetical protein
MARWPRQYRGTDRYPTWSPESTGPPSEDTTYNRVARVLADPAMTRAVIVAAARALDVLYGPNPTVDGDDAAMTARTQLAAAFVDAKSIREGVMA